MRQQTAELPLWKRTPTPYLGLGTWMPDSFCPTGPYQIGPLPGQGPHWGAWTVPVFGARGQVGLLTGSAASVRPLGAGGKDGDAEGWQETLCLVAQQLLMRPDEFCTPDPSVRLPARVPAKDRGQADGGEGQPAEETESGWAQEEMSGARMWDQRCVRSLESIVRKLAAQPKVAFSAAVGHAGRQAAHRICGNEQVTPQHLVAGHVARTAGRCRGHELVLVDQDTMVADCSHHPSKKGLGHISKDPDSRGYFLHSAFALSEEGQPLGLLSVRMWARDPEAFGRGGKWWEREFAEKESYKWVECLMDVEAALAPEQRVLLVSDRESDIFDYMAAPRRANTHLLIRACYPRRVEMPGENGPTSGKLFDMVAGAPAAGTLTVLLPRKPGKRRREAVLTVQYLQMRVLAPGNRRKAEADKAQQVSVVRAVELEPPAGEEAVEWVLLTSLPVTGYEDACRIIQYYTRRWTIERFHYTLKSGFEIEKLQVDEAHPLMNTVSLYCVAAMRVMSLAYLERTSPDAPAAEALSEAEVQVLSAHEGRPIAKVGEAVLAIAKLGGFEPCPSAGHPGPKAVWTGMRTLAAMVTGWRLAIGWRQPTMGSPNDCVWFCEAG